MTVPLSQGQLTEAQTIAWLNEAKQEIDPTTAKPVSWEKLGAAIGINHKTLSLIAGGHYNAPVAKFIEQIGRYRQQQARRDAYQRGVIRHPGRVEMPVSERIIELLDIAHGGKMTLICTESGAGKSYNARHYKKTRGANVFLATLDETTSTLTTMVARMVEAMGGTPRNSKALNSRWIVEKLNGAKALLIIDEAGCGDRECLEQWRHWQDATGCGLALMGNHDLHLLVSGAKKMRTFARLNSRFLMRMPSHVTLVDDIPLYLDAYGVTDRKVREMLTNVGLNHNAGGLREIDHTLEVASTIASAEQAEITLDHIKAALELRGLDEMGSPL